MEDEKLTQGYRNYIKDMKTHIEEMEKVLSNENDKENLEILIESFHEFGNMYFYDLEPEMKKDIGSIKEYEEIKTEYNKALKSYFEAHKDLCLKYVILGGGK